MRYWLIGNILAAWTAIAVYAGTLTISDGFQTLEISRPKTWGQNLNWVVELFQSNSKI